MTSFIDLIFNENDDNKQCCIDSFDKNVLHIQNVNSFFVHTMSIYTHNLLPLKYGKSIKVSNFSLQIHGLNCGPV